LRIILKGSLCKAAAGDPNITSVERGIWEYLSRFSTYLETFYIRDTFLLRVVGPFEI